VTPYYDEDGITLYLGDCREVTAWLSADVLVTDPPYGMSYASRYSGQDVEGDIDTTVRDAALALWGRKRPAMVFGSWRNARPVCDQVLVWDKGEEAALGHPVFFSAHEEVYVIGTGWIGPRRSNVVRVRGLARGGQLRKDLDHPTPKPVSLMETLLAHCPPGVVADPFAGSGATLIAARNLGRRAIGVEVEERHCAKIAGRLAQGDLFGETA
jgi:site-specific DNA-methyltransferase (adenine-specific)